MNRHQTVLGLVVASLAAILLGMLAGCSAKPAPQPQITELPAGSFVAQWRRELTDFKGVTIKELHLNDDKVLAYTTDNRCFWLNRAGGHLAAFSQLAGPREQLHAPTTVPNHVIFSSTTGLNVFDRQGKQLYKIRLAFSASSPAVFDEGRLFLGMDHPGGGRLAAIDLKPQAYVISPPWELMTFGQLPSRPAVFDHMVFCGSRDGRVYAVRGDTRDPLWPGLERGFFRTDGEILAELKADAEGVYVASMDSKLYCLNPTNGKLRWIYHAGNPLREYSSPIVTAESVYLHIPGVGVAAINKTEAQPVPAAPAADAAANPAEQDGKGEGMSIRKHRWVVPGGKQLLAIDDHHVYIATTDNQIVAADKQTGQIKFQSKRKDLTIFATNADPKDGTIYAASPTGQILSIRPVLMPGTVGEWVMAN